MNHRMLRMPAGWEWHMLTDGRAPSDWLTEPRKAPAQPGTERSGSAAPQSGPDRTQTGPGTAGTEAPAPGTGTPGAGVPGSGLPGTGVPGGGLPGANGAVLTAGMTRAAATTAIKRRLPECANWIDASMERRDTLAVSTETPDAGDTVFGTLPLRMSADEQDVCPLHYWLTEKRLVTMQFDLRFMLRLQRSPWEERLARAASAPEAFAVILTAALETLRGGFEAVERRLAGLETAAARSGRPIPPETLAELQRGLMQWNRHLLAVVEAESAAAESFGRRLTDSEPYRRLHRRLSLIRALIGRHAEAIGTLTALGGAAATRKNGALLRALSVAALVPVPAAAAGALWGMSTGVVPIAEEPAGFAAVCGGAALLSLLLYAWLRRMARSVTAGGQTGDRRGAHAVARSADAQHGLLPGGAESGAGKAGPAELPSRSKRVKRR